MILGAHHVQITIPVGKEDAARQFYCNVLGLVEIEKPEVPGGRGGFWLEIQGFQIHVGTETVEGRDISKAHVAYLVDDLQKWQRRLSEYNVGVLHGTPIPGYSRFEFRDPFGNRVEFLQADE